MGPSSEALAEKQHVTELALQKVATTLDDHLERCADGQERVEAHLEKIDHTLVEIIGAVKKVSDAQLASASEAKGAADARKPKWWVTPVTTLGGVLLAAIIGLVGWMGGRLVTDNDHAIAAAQARPSAVMVNQAPPVPPAQPAAIYPGPILPANP